VPEIEIDKHTRTEAIASIRRYCAENLEKEVGELAAGLLLQYFFDELGPIIYNKAITDVQKLLGRRVADLSGELYAPEFTYWPELEKKRRQHR